MSPSLYLGLSRYGLSSCTDSFSSSALDDKHDIMKLMPHSKPTLLLAISMYTVIPIIPG